MHSILQGPNIDVARVVFTPRVLALTIPIAIPTLVSVLMGLLRVVMFIVAIVIIVLCNGKTAQYDCRRYKSARRQKSNVQKQFSSHVLRSRIVGEGVYEWHDE